MIALITYFLCKETKSIDTPTDSPTFSFVSVWHDTVINQYDFQIFGAEV